MCNSLRDEILLESCIVECSLPSLINHQLARDRLQLLDDIMSVFSSHKQPTHWSLLANHECMASARWAGLLSCQLWWWTIEERWFMSFTGMNDRDTSVATRLQHR